MRIAVVALLLMLSSVALAGCSDSGGRGDDADTSSSSSGTGTGTGSSSSSRSTTSSQTTTSASGTNSSGSNRAPTGGLTATPANGTAPLAVQFTINASDADGDVVRWTLAFGDGASANGTGPGSASHTYAAGNHTATLNLTDGKGNTTVTAKVDVASGSAPPSGAQPVVYTGTVLAPDPWATILDACVNDLLLDASTAGNAGNGFPVQAAWAGWSYTIAPASLLVTFMTSTFVSGHGGTVPSGATVVAVCGVAPTHANVPFTLTLAPV